MPELPEVETIRRELLKEVKGKKISSVQIIDYKNADRALIKNALAQIKNIKRRAKLFIFELANGNTMLVHLKLTGYFLAQKKGEDKKSSVTHVIFTFSDGSALIFNDPRKFGFIKLVKTADLDVDKKFGFGPEPLPASFDLKTFKELLAKKKNSQLKPTLMDQHVIAGIGNIYSDEICYEASIKPNRKIGTLNEAEIKKLHKSIKNVLNRALKAKAAFVDLPTDVYGKRGGYINKLRAYRQQKCPKGHPVKLIKIGGRTGHYCSQCQK